jgi:hypothetical protein
VCLCRNGPYFNGEDLLEFYYPHLGKRQRLLSASLCVKQAHASVEIALTPGLNALVTLNSMDLLGTPSIMMMSVLTTFTVTSSAIATPCPSNYIPTATVLLSHTRTFKSGDQSHSRPSSTIYIPITYSMIYYPACIPTDTTTSTETIIITTTTTNSPAATVLYESCIRVFESLTTTNSSLSVLYISATPTQNITASVAPTRTSFYAVYSQSTSTLSLHYTLPAYQSTSRFDSTQSSLVTATVTDTAFTWVVTQSSTMTPISSTTHIKTSTATETSTHSSI